MTAAIYARKSTEQVGVIDDARSVTRQVEHARAFALARQWTVHAQHIYVDDGISGAIFGAGRPGLLRLLNALTPTPAFDVLVMSEESRLGREMHQTAHLFGEIVRAGVRVWFYLDGRERTLDTAVDKMMLSLTTFAAELEREKARQRTRDAMLRRATAGHVTGGRVYGYANVRHPGHVARVIVEREAEIVRQIFTRAAHGEGLRAIAHALNRLGVPAPRPQRGRPAGWAPSSIFAILRRPLYRGIIEWDRARRNPERRQLHRSANPTPLQIEAPHLRIIPPALAAAVDARRADRRTRYLTATGTTRGGPGPRRVRYLLAGLLRCTCGALLEATQAAYGKRRGGVYVCSAYRRKGATVCAQALHLPMAPTEAAILTTVLQQMTDPGLLETALDLAADTLLDDAARAAQQAEHDQITRELAHLVTALSATGHAPSVVDAIREREQRRQQLAHVLAAPREDRDTLRARLTRQHEAWAQGLTTGGAEGNRVLRAVLDGPIDIRPDVPPTVSWCARSAFGPLHGILTDIVAD